MEFKPHAKLTATLRNLLWISIGVTVVAVLAGFYRFYSYSRLPSGVDANEIMLPSDHVNDIVALAQIVLVIVTGITFLRWTYRSNKNLRAFSGESMKVTPGWSVGWHFVPIANFWKPYQVMKEIWNVSHKGTPTAHSLVGWWWAVWIIANYISGLAINSVERADDASGYAASAVSYMISDGVDVILYVVTLVMVTRIGLAYSQNIVKPTGEAHGGAAASPPSLT